MAKKAVKSKLAELKRKFEELEKVVEELTGEDDDESESEDSGRPKRQNFGFYKKS